MPLARLVAAQVLSRIGLYLILFPVHFALSGLALAVIAVKAPDGDTDAWFWLAFAWVTLQMLRGFPIMALNGLALAFAAVEATKGNAGWIFWTCFAWLAASMVLGGATRRAIVVYRRRGRARARAGSGQADWGPAFAWFVSSFGADGTASAPPTTPRPGAGQAEPDIVVDPAAASDAAREPHGQTPEDLVDSLERLAALREAGELSEEEYEQAKQRLLE